MLLQLLQVTLNLFHCGHGTLQVEGQWFGSCRSLARMKNGIGHFLKSVVKRLETGHGQQVLPVAGVTGTPFSLLCSGLRVAHEVIPLTFGGIGRVVVA